MMKDLRIDGRLVSSKQGRGNKCVQNIEIRKEIASKYSTEHTVSLSLSFYST